MKKRFADIHCHPHARSFHWLRETKIEKEKRHFHAWNVVISNFKMQRKGKRAFSYSQCDPVKLWNGDVKLVYASLYPFERGFFKEKKGISIIKILNQVSKAGLSLLFPWKLLIGIRSLTTAVFGGSNSLRDYFQAFVMKMPLKRINFITDDSKYDYFKELEREYLFLLKKSNARDVNGIYIPPGFRSIVKNVRRQRKKHPESLHNVRDEDEKIGLYKVCQNYNEVKETIEDDDIAMVLTIEGMHALGSDTISFNELEKRIMEIKNWQYPVFFITFAHHFDNGLNGHAHSFPKISTFFMNQETRMNEGFSNDGNGLKAARLLLSLNDQLDEDFNAFGRRIHIDLKHSSAKSRKEYYDKIVGPCFNKGIEIPVILSHVGYSGWYSLDETIQYADNDQEKDDSLKDGFYAWNINACGQDIEWATKTNVLVGICLDQRILGGGSKHKTGTHDLVFNNIEAMLESINKMEQKYRIRNWDVLCLGTDFEGYIDPINKYGNALNFDRFYDDLLEFIEDHRKLGRWHFPLDISDEQLADKICFDNARKFLETNFK